MKSIIVTPDALELYYKDKLISYDYLCNFSHGAEILEVEGIYVACDHWNSEAYFSVWTYIKDGDELVRLDIDAVVRVNYEKSIYEIVDDDGNFIRNGTLLSIVDGENIFQPVNEVYVFGYK